MGTRLRDVLMRELGELRYEPIEKRIRGTLGERTVIDSTRAMLVWEPKRIVPTYAVPVEDVEGEISAAPPAGPSEPRPAGVAAMDAPRLGDRPVFDPSIPFSVHTAEGEPVTIRGRADREAAAFRASDPALAGYVILDFAAFDAW